MINHAGCTIICCKTGQEMLNCFIRHLHVIMGYAQFLNTGPQDFSHQSFICPKVRDPCTQDSISKASEILSADLVC